jgi:Fe-S cluster assembly ATP-binding protein
MTKTRKSLIVTGLEVSRSGRKIVHGIDLKIAPGEVVAIMGPNGSGKSTLANALMGHPLCETAGRIVLDGRDLSGLAPDERSRAGLFLSGQTQPDIPGVTLEGFLRAAVNARRDGPLSAIRFHDLLVEKMKEIGFDAALAARTMEGFSGGEKKRAEMLALALLEPKYAVLDETDSGLDVDALKAVAKGIILLRASGLGILIITHYARLLNLVRPDRVHIMLKGRLVHAGGKEVVGQVERGGYAKFSEDKPRRKPQ